DDISSITNETIRIFGEFDESINMASWHVTWVSAVGRSWYDLEDEYGEGGEWNGSIYNATQSWIDVGIWNGSIYNTSSWTLIEEWNGSIYNTSTVRIIEEWNGSIYNATQLWIDIETWNGSIYNTSTVRLIEEWNGSIYNVSAEFSEPTETNSTIGYGFNTTINVSIWNNGTGIASVYCNVTFPDSTYYNYTMNNIVDEFYNQEINLTDIFRGWQIGQHDYTIIVIDDVGDAIESNVHSFNVSADINLSMKTVYDNYTAYQDVNITGAGIFGYTNCWYGAGGAYSLNNLVYGSKFTAPENGFAINITAGLKLSIGSVISHVPY
ncbi:unnamed protein product, partial [marine sediment metagenome]